MLQTADIILYKATVVPVGADQLQHLELAREIVRRFNGRWGEYFPEPEGATVEYAEDSWSRWASKNVEVDRQYDRTR